MISAWALFGSIFGFIFFMALMDTLDEKMTKKDHEKNERIRKLGLDKPKVWMEPYLGDRHGQDRV